MATSNISNTLPVGDWRINVSSMDLDSAVALAYKVWCNISSTSQRSLFSQLFSSYIEENSEHIANDIETLRTDVLRIRDDISEDEFSWSAAFVLTQLGKAPYSDELLREAIKLAADGHPAAFSREEFISSVTKKVPSYIGGYDSIVSAVVKTTGTVESSGSR